MRRAEYPSLLGVESLGGAARGGAGRKPLELMSDYLVLPPVEFDFGAAEAAAEACREMADRLDLVLLERARAGETARAEWEGSASRDFDTISGALRSEGTDLRSQLLSTASQIDAAADDARAENGRRDEENVRRREEAQSEEAQGAEPAGRPR